MLKNREGELVPNVTFRTRGEDDWVDVTTEELFAGRTVIVFSLPGAFTPTCSSSHVPRFEQLAPLFKQHGVDEIVCVSVNDAFVMREWQRGQGAGSISFLPDGNGEFTAGMGMLVNKEDLGFGKRSWRYSMLVRDQVVEKMFIEPEVPGDPFQVSDADTMLAYLAPQAALPVDVTVFTREGCAHCTRAKTLLADQGMSYDELVLNRDYRDRTLRAISPEPTFPQVFINGVRVGGADELEDWLQDRQAA